MTTFEDELRLSWHSQRFLNKTAYAGHASKVTNAAWDYLETSNLVNQSFSQQTSDELLLQGG